MLQKSSKVMPIEQIIKNKNAVNSRIQGSNLPPVPSSFSKRGSYTKQMIEPIMVDNVLAMGPQSEFFTRNSNGKEGLKVYNS